MFPRAACAALVAPAGPGWIAREALGERGLVRAVAVA
jgi:hypothetical protein